MLVVRKTLKNAQSLRKCSMFAQWKKECEESQVTLNQIL